MDVANGLHSKLESGFVPIIGKLPASLQAVLDGDHRPPRTRGSLPVDYLRSAETGVSYGVQAFLCSSVSHTHVTRAVGQESGGLHAGGAMGTKKSAPNLSVSPAPLTLVLVCHPRAQVT